MAAATPTLRSFSPQGDTRGFAAAACTHASAVGGRRPFRTAALYACTPAATQHAEAAAGLLGLPAGGGAVAMRNTPSASSVSKKRLGSTAASHHQLQARG